MKKIFKWGAIVLGVIIILAVISADGGGDQTRTESSVDVIETSEPTPTQTPKKSGVTMDQFTRLETGMTYKEVIEILGSEGEEISRVDMAGYTTVMYQWDGSSFASNMNAMFQNGKMMSKAQFGLK